MSIATIPWLVWDDVCDQELAEAEAELQRSHYVEPVSPEAAVRMRERIGRLERIIARLRARKENAS